MVATGRPTARKGEIWLVNLDPVIRSEIRKTRPCVIVSPDELNRHLRTIIVASMTSSLKSYVSRVPISFAGKDGQVAVDQIRTIDRQRLERKLGTADASVMQSITTVTLQMFA